VSEPHDVQEDFYYGEPIENGFAHVIKFQGHEIVLLHRRKYKACSETPTKGFFKMDAPQKKMLLKAIFGIGTSLLLGKLIKLERQIEDRINDRIDEKYPDSEDTTEED